MSKTRYTAGPRAEGVGSGRRQKEKRERRRKKGKRVRDGIRGLNNFSFCRKGREVHGCRTVPSVCSLTGSRCALFDILPTLLGLFR